MTEFGLDPVLSHVTSYRLSATRDDGGLRISTVSGFTVNETMGLKGLEKFTVSIYRVSSQAAVSVVEDWL